MKKIWKSWAGASAAIAVAVLIAGQPAIADTIRLSGFWAGHGTATINFSGTNYHDGSFASFTESGGSGGFRTYNLTTDPGRLNSFQSWCVDIFHSFSFPVSGPAVLNAASLVLGSTKATDLGRLFTNHHAVIDSSGSTATNQSAFQLAVWEIANETASNLYSLASGAFSASGTGSSLAATWLNELNTTPSTSAFNVSIWSMQQGPSGSGPQDVAVFAPIPEPETYAMLLAGLGLMGFVVWRRQRSLAAA